MRAGRPVVADPIALVREARAARAGKLAAQLDAARRQLDATWHPGEMGTKATRSHTHRRATKVRESPCEQCGEPVTSLPAGPLRERCANCTSPRNRRRRATPLIPEPRQTHAERLAERERIRHAAARGEADAA